jgi:hypothetical protein
VQAGIAAATVNTAMQVGGSIGIAALNTIAVAAARGFAGTPHTVTTGENR